MPSVVKPSASVSGSWHEAYSSASQASGADAWEDWDISAIVGAAAVLALVEYRCIVTNAEGGVRANGSSLERKAPTAIIAQSTWIVPVLTDSAGIIERFQATATTSGEFRVLGWWD